MQDVFLNLWIKRNTAETIQSLSAYLFTAVKYSMLNHMKAEGVRKDFASNFSRFIALDHRCNAEEELAEQDLSTALHRNISKLPPKCREIFHLSRINHQSIADISISLNISPRTVENQLTKALRFLRLELKDFFIIVFAILL